MQEVITTSSNLLSESQEPSWQDLPQAVQADTALDIVNTVEDSAFQVAKVINTPLATPIIHVEVNIGEWELHGKLAPGFICHSDSSFLGIDKK